MRRYAFAAAAALLCHLTISGDGQAAAAEQQSWLVRSISDRGVLTLVDGRRLCLSNIWLGGDLLSKQQKLALQKVIGELIGGREVRVDEDGIHTFDRYGCLLADVETGDGISLPRALLKRGLALVQPSLSSNSPADIHGLLAIEEKARSAGLGLWQDQRFRPKQSIAMAKHVGKFSLVEGRVVRTSDNDRYVYLNFGQDWRTDFTVRIRKKLLKQDEIEPGLFDDKQIRVRGFVQEARGPLIDISHLKQIEVMP